jgi:hypothetical protein
MMLYEDAIIQFLYSQDDDFTCIRHYDCRVTIDDAGVTEIVIPQRQQTVTTHIQNVLIISKLKTVDPDPGNGIGEINPATIGDYQYCDICGQLIHNDIWDTHVVECLSTY